jgi:hypothetical protein
MSFHRIEVETSFGSLAEAYRFATKLSQLVQLENAYRCAAGHQWSRVVRVDGQIVHLQGDFADFTEPF